MSFVIVPRARSGLGNTQLPGIVFRKYLVFKACQKWVHVTSKFTLLLVHVSGVTKLCTWPWIIRCAPSHQPAQIPAPACLEGLQVSRTVLGYHHVIRSGLDSSLSDIHHNKGGARFCGFWLLCCGLWAQAICDLRLFSKQACVSCFSIHLFFVLPSPDLEQESSSSLRVAGGGKLPYVRQYCYS